MSQLYCEPGTSILRNPLVHSKHSSTAFKVAYSIVHSKQPPTTFKVVYSMVHNKQSLTTFKGAYSLLRNPLVHSKQLSRTFKVTYSIVHSKKSPITFKATYSVVNNKLPTSTTCIQHRSSLNLRAPDQRRRTMQHQLHHEDSESTHLQRNQTLQGRHHTCTSLHIYAAKGGRNHRGRNPNSGERKCTATC